MNKTNKSKITTEYIKFLFNLVNNDAFIGIKRIKNKKNFYKYKIEDKFLLLCSDGELFKQLQNNNIYTIYYLVLTGSDSQYGKIY